MNLFEGHGGHHHGGGTQSALASAAAASAISFYSDRYVKEKEVFSCMISVLPERKKGNLKKFNPK